MSATPGPWRVYDAIDIWATDPEGYLRQRVATLHLVGDKVERQDRPDYDFPETDANAHLIAAAPLLLEALERAKRCVVGHDHAFEDTTELQALETCWLAAATRALAAARGESPAVPA